jgi:hypothetical protein
MKDWAWIKTQWRESPVLWVSVAIWFVSGFLPLLPVYINKGAGHVYYVGRFPLFSSYLDLVGHSPWIIGHIVLSGLGGLVIWRTIGRFACSIHSRRTLR